MKRQIFSYLTATAVAVSAVFTSCDKDDDEKSIKVESGKIEQTVYADNTTGESAVTFVTTGAWTSSITESTAKATKAGTAMWISIDPDHGNEAGPYTIYITCEPNTTGEDRKAIITITCNGTSITFSFEQMATMENGEPYEDPETNVIKTLTVQVEGGSTLNSQIDDVKAILWPWDWGSDDVKGEEVANAVFSNGGFTITLPDNVNSALLNPIVDDFPAGIKFSNPNAKYNGLTLFAFKSGTPVGRILYQTADGNSGADLIFADSDVVMTGSVSYSEQGINYIMTCNTYLNKGWNLTFVIFEASGTTINQTLTSNNPGNMKWYLSEE